MDYIEYEIAKGESLEAIATLKNISISELIEFHNSHSNMTHQLTSNYIPLHLKTLYVAKSTANDPNFKISPNILEKNLKYKINFYQKLVANDKNFADTNSEIVWDLKFVIYNQKIIVEITIESNEVKNQTSATAELIEFAKVFNFPVSKLIIELDNFGSIHKVINQEEIYNKWQFIRQKELYKYEEDEGMKGVFVAGETEFSNTLPTLINNPMYFLFFDSVYGEDYSTKIAINIDKEIYSKLFQGQKITLENNKMVNMKDKVIVKNEYLNSSINKKELKENFLINYKDLVGNEWDYSNTILSSATYDIENGTLDHLSSKCTEKANSNLYHESIYKIEQIK